MKTLRNIITLFVMLFAALPQVLGQAAEVAQPVEVSTPMYQKLGISSTALFIVMTLVTILLVIIVMSLAGVVKRLIQAEREKFEKAAKILILGFIFFYSTPSFAAETTTSGESWIAFSDSNFWMFVGMDIVLVLIIFYFRSLINSFMPEGIRKESFLPWLKFKRTLTGKVVEIEEEGSILMDHNYDGIHELDNDLPPWWKYGFYITIVWAVVYFGYYQVFGVGLSQEQEYLTEMEEGDAAVEAYKAAHPELINKDNVELLTDASSISAGKQIYEEKCISCHMEGGAGGIGPNLTDDYWIYEGDIKGVFESVSEGRQNGMIAWKEFIAPDKIQLVASYVLSLEPAANGKEPQGDLKTYEE